MSFSFAESPNVLVDFQSMGSACGVWEDGLATYVVSAAHVFDQAGSEPLVQWVDGSFNIGSGVLRADLLWQSTSAGPLDAGIVRIEDPGPFRLGGDYPYGSDILEWDAITEDLVVKICGKHGTRLAGSVRKQNGGLVFENHRHGRLLIFPLMDGETLPGDSGAAVVSMPEGMLVGHHVTLHHDDQGIACSVVVPAADVRDLFRDRLGAFEPRP